MRNSKFVLLHWKFNVSIMWGGSTLNIVAKNSPQLWNVLFLPYLSRGKLWFLQEKLSILRDFAQYLVKTSDKDIFLYKTRKNCIFSELFLRKVTCHRFFPSGIAYFFPVFSTYLPPPQKTLGGFEIFLGKTLCGSTPLWIPIPLIESLFVCIFFNKEKWTTWL